VPERFRWQTAQLQEEAVGQVPERLQGQATQLQAQEIELEQTDQERKQEQVVQREAEAALDHIADLRGLGEDWRSGLPSRNDKK